MNKYNDEASNSPENHRLPIGDDFQKIELLSAKRSYFNAVTRRKNKRVFYSYLKVKKRTKFLNHSNQ